MRTFVWRAPKTEDVAHAARRHQFGAVGVHGGLLWDSGPGTAAGKNKKRPPFPGGRLGIVTRNSAA